MKKNVLVQEAISLLEELEGVNTEPQPEDQKSLKKKKSSKKKNSNPKFKAKIVSETEIQSRSLTKIVTFGYCLIMESG
mgnify:CR=1 FL=1